MRDHRSPRRATWRRGSDARPRIVAWGTYDTGKPRVRILLRGLDEAGAQIAHCHEDVWQGVEDKSMVRGWAARARFLARWLSRYPQLVHRYLRLPEHDVVFVGYMGQLDVLVLWPFAKWRGVPIVWDAFLSLYNTVVEDRKLVAERHPVARALHAWEWLACRAASLVVADTEAHARYFQRRFDCAPTHTAAVLVGAETDVFDPASGSAPVREATSRFSILFYGQFIPLHGIDTIIDAAKLLRDRPYDWQLIGGGQEADRIRSILNEDPLPNVSWTPWVPYRELSEWIARADVCLGIFDDSEKAANVIPNKVFQILAMGKPLITRDSPAIRELLSPSMPGVYLVPPGDPHSLADAIVQHAEQATSTPHGALHREVRRQIEPRAIGRRLLALIGSVTKR